MAWYNATLCSTHLTFTYVHCTGSKNAVVQTSQLEKVASCVFFLESCPHPVLPHSSFVVVLIFAPNHRLLLGLPGSPLDPVLEKQPSAKSVIYIWFIVRMRLINCFSTPVTLTVQGKTGPQCINATHSSS